MALFAVAATPLPDEPVVIPLGLLKYNPIKFFLAFFAGKLSITIAGAYFAKTSEALLAPWLSQEALIVISIVFTIAITVLLLKVDVVKLAEKVLKRKIA